MAVRPFNYNELPKPPQKDLEAVAEWLKSDTSLIVEIGAGVGMHAIKKAQELPNKQILAIERTKEKFLKLESRANSHDLPNLYPLHAEATIFLPHLLNKKKVDQYYFLYPNPYPKESQKNLRWGHSPFMHFVKDSLKPKGTVTFATNIESYKDELLVMIPQFGFKLTSCDKIIANPRTHFEKKYILRNQSCWNLVFIKCS